MGAQPEDHQVKPQFVWFAYAIFFFFWLISCSGQVELHVCIQVEGLTFILSKNLFDQLVVIKGLLFNSEKTEDCADPVSTSSGRVPRVSSGLSVCCLSL